MNTETLEKENKEKEVISPKPTRALALDALRGIAILGMILSSRIPDNLPNWMFHAQNPPPSHALSLIPGISWVDLVFPFFLFAMGAAFPFALTKKLEQGRSKILIVKDIFVRGILLFFFAVTIQHIRPTSLNPQPNVYTNLLAIFAFIALFFSFAHLPQIDIKTSKILKYMGFGSLAFFLALAKYPSTDEFNPKATSLKLTTMNTIQLKTGKVLKNVELAKMSDSSCTFIYEGRQIELDRKIISKVTNFSSFKITRSDIIILVLANMAFFGSIIWLFTKDKLLIRLSIFGFLFAFRLTQNVDGSWMKYLWDNFQIPWLFKIYYLQYLFIVIPGTIIGDVILKWIKNKKDEVSNDKYFNKPALISMLIVLAGYVVTMLITLISRYLITAAVVTFLFSSIFLYIFSKAKSEDERLLKTLFRWASYWLIIGIMFEAYEGGIQKAKPTLSFYFITVGLAIISLMVFTIIINMLKKEGAVSLLISNGQNPMIAYAGGTNLITPLLSLTYIDSFLQYFAVTPWLGAFKGLIVTLFLAYIIAFFTKFKVFWRT